MGTCNKWHIFFFWYNLRFTISPSHFSAFSMCLRQEEFINKIGRAIDIFYNICSAWLSSGSMLIFELLLFSRAAAQFLIAVKYKLLILLPLISRLFRKIYQIRFVHTKILTKMQHHILKKLFTSMRNWQSSWSIRVTPWMFLHQLLIRFLLTILLVC